MAQFLSMAKLLRGHRPFFLKSPARGLGFAATAIISGPTSLSHQVRALHRLRFQQHREAALLRGRITVTTFPSMYKSISHLVKVLALELRCLHEAFHVISLCLLELLSFLVGLGLRLIADLMENLLPARKTAPKMSQQ